MYACKPRNYQRKVGVREEEGIQLTPDELTAHGQRFINAIRDYSPPGKIAGRSMPIYEFLVRRTAQHVMDHAWEMEDRDLTS